ncbi:MAG: terpene cyclase/mutase family protein, partial [Thermoplasmatales archaeon]|nr:terpene cyclase/mutase family protein [Thermoplasmatales archaeon]
MKKISATMIILLIGITLVNIPADILTPVSADSGEDYPYQPTNDIIIQALDYLRNQQISDGSIGGFSISAWAAMAISAAGEDPNDWSDLVEYLRENVNRIDENKATDWERQTLAIVACNEDPRSFDGIDYLAKIENFYDGDQIGSSANLYDDFFGILSLVSGGVDKDSSIVQTVRVFIKEKQNENGGWGDVDSTAAAIMALVATGEYSNSECITDALSYVKTTQAESGGFKSWGTENTASTAWAVMAIVAAGQNPTSIEWKHSGNSAIDFLLSLQQENGAFNWSAHQNMSPEWMTSYAILALLGKPYPVKIYESEGENDEFDEDNGEDASDDTN